MLLDMVIKLLALGTKMFPLGGVQGAQGT